MGISIRDADIIWHACAVIIFNDVTEALKTDCKFLLLLMKHNSILLSILSAV